MERLLCSCSPLCSQEVCLRLVLRILLVCSFLFHLSARSTASFTHNTSTFFCTCTSCLTSSLWWMHLRASFPGIFGTESPIFLLVDDWLYILRAQLSRRSVSHEGAAGLFQSAHQSLMRGQQIRLAARHLSHFSTKSCSFRRTRTRTRFERRTENDSFSTSSSSFIAVPDRLSLIITTIPNGFV